MTDRLASAPRKPGIPDVETHKAVRAFMARLEGTHSVSRAVLFGSRARGTHGPDSDADLAVILLGDRSDRKAAALDMAETAFDVLMETGVLIEALPLWEEEFENPESFTNPALVYAIHREGLTV